MEYKKCPYTDISADLYEVCKTDASATNAGTDFCIINFEPIHGVNVGDKIGIFFNRKLKGLGIVEYNHVGTIRAVVRVYINISGDDLLQEIRILRYNSSTEDLGSDSSGNAFGCLAVIKPTIKIALYTANENLIDWICLKEQTVTAAAGACDEFKPLTISLNQTPPFTIPTLPNIFKALPAQPNISCNIS